MTNEERGMVLEHAAARLEEVYDSMSTHVICLVQEARELAEAVGELRTGKTDGALDAMLQQVAHLVGDMKARRLVCDVGEALDAQSTRTLEAHYALVEELRERDTQFRELLNLS